MKNDLTLQNLLKLNAMLVMIIGFCDIMVVIFFQGLNSWEKWKVESLKIFILLLLSSCILPLLFRLKIKHKTFGYVFGGEMITYSILLFVSLMNGYYGIYGVINWKVMGIYIILIITACILSRKAARKLCEKLLSGEKIGDKDSYKLEDATLNGIVLCTIIFSRHLTMDMQYVVNIVISLCICFFWSFMGFFMIMMKPVNDEDILNGNSNPKL